MFSTWEDERINGTFDDDEEALGGFEPTEEDYENEVSIYENDDLLELGFDPYAGTYESDLWDGLDFLDY